MQRIAELQREGLWSEKRLPKVAEPPRAKTHWDYLLEEMEEGGSQKSKFVL